MFAKTQTGTPFFMAPEVALHEKYTEKCDIYSLCATFYEVIKNKIPYDLESISNPIQLIMRKNNPENYEPILENEFAIPEVIEMINFNLTAKAEERNSAQEIHEKLEELSLSHLPESWSESIVELETVEPSIENEAEESHLMLGKKSLVQSSLVVDGKEEEIVPEMGQGGGGLGGGMMMSSMMGEGGDFNPSQLLMGTFRIDDLKETESVMFENKQQKSKIDDVPEDCDYQDDFEDEDYEE